MQLYIHFLRMIGYVKLIKIFVEHKLGDLITHLIYKTDFKHNLNKVRLQRETKGETLYNALKYF